MNDLGFRPKARLACSAVVAGSTMPGTAVLLIATGTRLTSVTTMFPFACLFDRPQLNEQGGCLLIDPDGILSPILLGQKASTILELVARLDDLAAKILVWLLLQMGWARQYRTHEESF